MPTPAEVLRRLDETPQADLRWRQRMREEPATPALQDDLARELNDQLFKQFGPILPPSALAKALGYRSTLAYRQAIARNTVPVPLFRIPQVANLDYLRDGQIEIGWDGSWI